MSEVDSRQSTVESLQLTKVGSWELPQEADVVLEKDLDIVDAVLKHGETVDADPEGKATDFFRVVVDEAVDGGIDHAGAEEFNPSRAFALRTRSPASDRAGSAAEGTGDVKLDARLREGEIAGTETRLDARAEEFFYEILDSAGEITESDVGVNGEAFDLVEGERMRGVGIVTAIDLAGYDDAHGRLLLLHGANLHGRSVGAKKERRLRVFRQVQIESVHVVADGVKLGDIQGFEIVIRRFDFGAFDDGKTDGEEDVFDFLEDLTDQVMGADGTNDAGKGEVDALASGRDFFRSFFSSDPKYFERLLDVALELVQRLTDNRFQTRRGRLEPILSDESKHASFPA